MQISIAPVHKRERRLPSYEEGMEGASWAAPVGDADGEAREPIHPAVNQPLEMRVEVCTMSAPTPPGSLPGPRGFHSQEFTDPT